MSLLRGALAKARSVVARVASRAGETQKLANRLADAAALVYLLGYERLVHLRAGRSASRWKREATKPGS